MKRSMFQVYVQNATAAIALYQQALGAKLLEIVHSPEGQVVHSELDVYGQILAVADRSLYGEEADQTGNIMQLCLHFSKEGQHLVETAAEALQTGGQVLFPLGPSFYCALMIDVIDPHGVRWCLFAE